MYLGEDSGLKRKLDACVAPKRFYVKLGAPVVLTCNLSDTLVNGRRGEITHLGPKEVKVRFAGLHSETLISMFDFTMADVKSNNIVATRPQLPLRLGYALTVHKAQGLTLPSVSIDARHMNLPGQLGVAIGRAQLKCSIKLEHYDRRLIRKQPNYVADYYCCESPGPLADLTCCRGRISTRIPPLPTTTSVEDTASTSTLILEESLTQREDVDEGCVAELDQLILNSLASEKYGTPKAHHQRQVNHAISKLLTPEIRDKRQQFICKAQKEISTVFDACLSKPTSTNRDTTMFYAQMQEYLSSTKYDNQVDYLFHGQNVQLPVARRVAHSIITNIRVKCLKDAADVLKFRAARLASVHEAPRLYDDHALANIRYIGGWVIAKLIGAKQQLIKSNLYNQHRVNFVADVKKYLETLEGLLSYEAYYKDEAMSEIYRKQYFTGALKVISKETLKFFAALDKVINQMENSTNLNNHGQDLYTYISNSLMVAEDIKGMFNTITSSDNSELFELVVEKYLVLSASHYRSRYKEEHNLKRKFEHRKEITRAAGKKTPAVKYPCGICAKTCLQNTVLCETCNKWHHYQCANLTGNEPALAENAPAWECVSCKNAKSANIGT